MRYERYYVDLACSVYTCSMVYTVVALSHIKYCACQMVAVPDSVYPQPIWDLTSLAPSHELRPGIET